MTETKVEKFVRKINKDGYVFFNKPVYTLQTDSVLFLSYEARENFNEVKTIRLPKTWKFTTFEETDSKGVFAVRQSTDDEILDKGDYAHRQSEIRVMNANAYITRENTLRFQRKDLKAIMTPIVGGFFYVHFVKNKKEYLEISFSTRKRLGTFQEEAIRKYGSVVEMNQLQEIDITYRVNAVGAGATFPVPSAFLSGIKKCTYLPYHYENKKVIVEKPVQKCSCCGKEISSYYEGKETVSVCKKCSETLDMISERTLLYCETTHDAIENIINNYQEIIESKESIRAEIEEANRKMSAVLGGKVK